MQKYIIIGSILILLIYGCYRRPKVKEVSGAKCVRCENVFHAETTLINAPAWFENSIRTPEGWVKQEFIFSYRDTTCEACAKTIKNEGEEAFQKGLKYFKEGNYGSALGSLREAIEKGQKDAIEWEKKAFIKWRGLVDRKYKAINREEKMLREAVDKEKFKKVYKRRTEKTVENVHFKIYPRKTPDFLAYGQHTEEIYCKITNNAKIQLKEFVIHAELFSKGKKYTGKYKAYYVHPLRNEEGTIIINFYGDRIDSIRIGKCKVWW